MFFNWSFTRSAINFAFEPAVVILFIFVVSLTFTFGTICSREAALLIAQKKADLNSSAQVCDATKA